MPYKRFRIAFYMKEIRSLSMTQKYEHVKQLYLMNNLNSKLKQHILALLKKKSLAVFWTSKKSLIASIKVFLLK